MPQRLGVATLPTQIWWHGLKKMHHSILLNPATFYGGNEVGYTDYPFLSYTPRLFSPNLKKPHQPQVNNINQKSKAHGKWYHFITA